jgi:hypothetical protein
MRDSSSRSDGGNGIQSQLQRRIEGYLPDVTIRPMFGYQCYSVKGKFFAGFAKKDKAKMIIRLSTDLQEKALQNPQPKIKPFSHGAKMGWVEIDMTAIDNIEDAFYWIRKGYDHALELWEEG